MKITIAGLSQHISWRERDGLNEVEAMSDEFGWDELFEALDGGSIDGGSVTARRVSTPMPIFHRPNDGVVKRAAVTNWDTEFVNMKNHVTSVLSNMGVTEWEKR